MTEEQPPRDRSDRLTALETAMTGLRETLAYRDRMFEDRIDRLDAQNRAQDAAFERFTVKLEAQVEKNEATLWRAMAWAVTTTGSLLVAAALKVLGLV